MKTKIYHFTIFLAALLACTTYAGNCLGQWEEDVRLTYNPAMSQLPGNYARNVAANGDTVHVVWNDYRDGNWEIYYKRSTDGGTSWEADVRLTNDAQKSGAPCIAVSGPLVIVAWEDFRISVYNSELFYKRSSDGGTTWETDIRLTNSSGISGGPSLVISGQQVHIAWSDMRDGGNWEVYYNQSADGGLTWGQDVRLTYDPALSCEACIGVSGSIVHVSWQDYRDGNDEIYYKRSQDGGISWEPDINLTNNTANSWGACLATSGSVIHLAWTEDKICYKSSTDGGSTWGATLGLTVANGFLPSLCVSETAVHVVWIDGSVGNNEIYYTCSPDGGISWEDSTRLTYAEGDSFYPRIAFSVDRLHVIWRDDRDGNWEIYYKRNVLSSNLELTFTAENNGDYVQLDSIKVINRTQGGETMIYWPDTMLSIENNPGDLLLCVGYATFTTVGVEEIKDEFNTFEVQQNYPNPMGNQSDFKMYLPQKGNVHLFITDLQGRVILQTDRQLDEGYHFYRFQPGGSNLYFLTARWNGISRSIKMISTGQQDGKGCRLDYVGSNTGEPVLKASLKVSDFIVRQSGILDSPQENTTYTFQFATNIPCPGMPVVEYEGQVYNTIQIFSQCWLKENLNVGTMIEGTIEQSNNGIIEKYCYNSDLNNCDTYGGLYQWDEMMQYTTQQGVKGICPPGWHIPTDDEWKVLEGAVDSLYGIGDNYWDDMMGNRGYDSGTNLKSTSGWNWSGDGTDLYGYCGLPGGKRSQYGAFYVVGSIGYWWTSTESNEISALYRNLWYNHPTVCRQTSIKGHLGYSVRCLRD